MKTTLLRTLLGAAALLSSTAFAHAAGPFVAGSHWTGFRVSTVGGGTSSAVLDVANNPSFGSLKILGQSVPVSIACTASGVVDFQGLGIPYAGFKVHGMVAAQGGTYSLSGNYFITNVPGMHNDKGRISLLRSYNKPTGGTIGGGGTGTGLVPPDPYIPPDPYLGSFTSSLSGLSNRLIFEHNPPADKTERPNDFDGALTFFTGDGSVKYAVVGTINPVANADGSRNIEMLGENLSPSSIVPCVKTYGLLLPAVRTNPTSILGNYELIGLLRTFDLGRFQVSP